MRQTNVFKSWRQDSRDMIAIDKVLFKDMPTFVYSTVRLHFLMIHMAQ